MSYKLFLDDLRDPEFVGWKTGEVTICRTEKEFIKTIKVRGIPEEVSFDHDLGDPENGTGKTCANFLISWCQDHKIDLPYYQSHSMNAPGRENILSVLDSYSRFCKSLTSQ